MDHQEALRSWRQLRQGLRNLLRPERGLAERPFQLPEQAVHAGASCTKQGHVSILTVGRDYMQPNSPCLNRRKIRRAILNRMLSRSFLKDG